ncbi:unnamed protein product, partial [Adineta steineri]
MKESRTSQDSDGSSGLAIYIGGGYIGTLTGVMWTVVGVVATIQYGLVQLTDDIPRSWKAWLIILSLV